MNNTHSSKELPDFSLVLGGPLFQLLVGSRLATPALELLKWRIVFFSLFAWLPLLLLSLVDGQAWGGAGLPASHDRRGRATASGRPVEPEIGPQPLFLLFYPDFSANLKRLLADVDRNG